IFSRPHEGRIPRLQEKVQKRVYYALVYYPDFDVRRIDDFRRKYDPHSTLINPHITFMFLVPEAVGEANLVRHIDKVLSGWHSFPVHLAGLEKSWDHWLFLLVAEGRESVTRLHRELYTGILAAYHRPDIEFVPHLGLGLFA